MATGRDPRLSERVLTEEQAARLETLCQRRESREPLQYLCGRWPFLDFELAVGPGVLCPRADTEVVAEAAAQTLAGCAAPKVLDLCAGTGCLGLGIKRLCPTASVTCVEKSPEALHYLVCNVRTALRSLPQGSTEDVLEEDEPTLGSGLLGIAALPPAAQAVEGDLFDYWRGLPEGGLDLIVSNPPYLTASEMEDLQPEVAKEPAMALAAGEDGLDFYRLWRGITRPRCAPAGRWRWRSAGSSGRLFVPCCKPKAGRRSAASRIWAAMTAASWPKDRKKDLLLSLKIKQLPVVISWICGILKGNRTAAF